MNRRDLLGVVGAMGTSMTLGGAHVFADGHGKTAGNKMMAPLGNHHGSRCCLERGNPPCRTKTFAVFWSAWKSRGSSGGSRRP